MKVKEAKIKYAGKGYEIPDATFRSPSDVAAFVRRVVDGDPREHFVSVLLDARHRPLAFEVISIGTATASLVHPREVFRAAILAGAVAIIVAHNHPSGISTPSREDVVVTERLIECGKLLGVEVLDSVVVAESEHTSLRDDGRCSF